MTENCINCDNFCWWDGDYCCLAKMVILDYSDGNGGFTKEILQTMKTSDECIDYVKSFSEKRNIYQEKFDEFMKGLA